jgi:hypothetical protein
MFGALLIHLAVIATPATVHDATQPTCRSVHCSATVNESAQGMPAPKQPAENCAGVHCGPVGEKAPASDTRYGGENLDTARAGSGATDRSFDSAHDTSGYDRSGYDNSGTWPAH